MSFGFSIRLHCPATAHIGFRNDLLPTDSSGFYAAGEWLELTLKSQLRCLEPEILNL